MNTLCFLSGELPTETGQCTQPFHRSRWKAPGVSSDLRPTGCFFGPTTYWAFLRTYYLLGVSSDLLPTGHGAERRRERSFRAAFPGPGNTKGPVCPAAPTDILLPARWSWDAFLPDPWRGRGNGSDAVGHFDAKSRLTSSSSKRSPAASRIQPIFSSTSAPGAAVGRIMLASRAASVSIRRPPLPIRMGGCGRCTDRGTGAAPSSYSSCRRSRPFHR